jgi:very-short-patch-repair endonuclease
MDTLQLHCKALGLPIPITEYRFHPTRRWRFDWAFPQAKLAVEQEGGIWIKGKSGRGGAHSLPTNILRDMEKSNEAAILGWRILRFTPQQVEKGVAALTIQRWFMANGVRGKE